MNLGIILTAATEGTETAPEVVEQATNFFQQAADWLNGNPVVVQCILFGVGALICVALYLSKKRK